MRSILQMASVMLILAVMPASAAGQTVWYIQDTGSEGYWDSEWLPPGVIDNCPDIESVVGECMNETAPPELGLGGWITLDWGPKQTVHYGPDCISGEAPAGYYYLRLWVWTSTDDAFFHVHLYRETCDQLCETGGTGVTWEWLLDEGLHEYYITSTAAGEPMYLDDERLWLEFEPDYTADIRLYWGASYPSCLICPGEFPTVATEATWGRVRSLYR